ncbi:MAG TPA: cytochrome c [Chromatiaceae bacterium]|nr:cytochrome c [Chromatiaceae bacterium]
MYKLLYITLLLVIAPLTRADKSFHPEEFHQQKCTGCHDTGIYTRSNRRVNSLPRLESQVRMCDANLGIKMFDDDIHSLVDYLNSNYYKFEP